MPSHRVPEIVAHIDGGSRGNPGPAAYGVAIENEDGSPVASLSKFLGRATNNVAEYEGLLAALNFALEHHHPRLRVLTDSELLARQIEGRYKVKSPDLKPLHHKAREMILRLERFTIRHVPREQNREADRLVNQALDAE
jgi:ribonuclease HI